MLGFVAAGLALGVGWKLGCHLVDTAFGKEKIMVSPEKEQSTEANIPEVGEVSQS